MRVEYTGGSTGSALAFVCAVKRYGFDVVSSDAFAPEKLKTMQAFGATLHLVHSATGQITPELIPTMMQRAQALAQSADTHFTDQFNNRDALVGYAQIGHAICWRSCRKGSTPFAAGSVWAAC